MLRVNSATALLTSSTILTLISVPFGGAAIVSVKTLVMLFTGKLADLPPNFHPATTGALWSFTPIGAG